MGGRSAVLFRDPAVPIFPPPHEAIHAAAAAAAGGGHGYNYHTGLPLWHFSRTPPAGGGGGPAELHPMAAKRPLPLAVLCLLVAATFLGGCDGRSSRRPRRPPPRDVRSSGKKLHAAKQHLTIYSSDDDDDPYHVGSPFTLPPYEDVMGSPLPSSSPAAGEPGYCANPSPPPSTGLIPAPVVYPPGPPPPSSPDYSSPPPPPPPPPIVVLIPSPPELAPTLDYPPPEQSPYPPGGYAPNPPETAVPSPFIVLPSPPGFVPSPTGFVPAPPSGLPNYPPPTYVPGPPSYAPRPPTASFPSPPWHRAPSPPPHYVFEPPVVYPPPSVPPPPQPGTPNELWCVAKPAVPDPIIQEAMNYACGSGADCNPIQPEGPCYQPDTLINHASYAFNSYWQRTRAAGGTCDFGGTAMMITEDPSVDGCHFITIALQDIASGE